MTREQQARKAAEYIWAATRQDWGHDDFQWVFFNDGGVKQKPKPPVEYVLFEWRKNEGRIESLTRGFLEGYSLFTTSCGDHKHSASDQRPIGNLEQVLERMALERKAFAAELAEPIT